MNERFKKLWERKQGKREKWTPKDKPTPKQVYDQIHGNFTEADFPPTQKDLDDKEAGLKRTTKRRNR